jgi:hypothetical protein
LPDFEAPSGAVELCALLRSLGLLALAHVAPGAVDQALGGAGAGLGERLRHVVGIDHRQALDVIVGRWKLPSLVAEVSGSATMTQELSAQVRPLVDRSHERSTAWWEHYAAVAAGAADGVAAPPEDFSAKDYGAAERLFTLVESCIPTH